jgi:hypothetical protein
MNKQYLKVFDGLGNDALIKHSDIKHITFDLSSYESKLIAHTNDGKEFTIAISNNVDDLNNIFEKLAKL